MHLVCPCTKCPAEKSQKQAEECRRCRPHCRRIGEKRSPAAPTTRHRNLVTGHPSHQQLAESSWDPGWHNTSCRWAPLVFVGRVVFTAHFLCLNIWHHRPFKALVLPRPTDSQHASCTNEGEVQLVPCLQANALAHVDELLVSVKSVRFCSWFGGTPPHICHDSVCTATLPHDHELSRSCTNTLFIESRPHCRHCPCCCCKTACPTMDTPKQNEMQENKATVARKNRGTNGAHRKHNACRSNVCAGMLGESPQLSIFALR